MRRTRVITVSGARSGVGKTRLIELLVPCLGRCAVVKARVEEGRELSELVEDDPVVNRQKDTGRYLAAGAERAWLITGPAEQVRRAVERIVACGQYEVVVVESNQMARQLDSDLSLFLRGKGESKPGAEACQRGADVVIWSVSHKRREDRCRKNRERR